MVVCVAYITVWTKRVHTNVNVNKDTTLMRRASVQKVKQYKKLCIRKKYQYVIFSGAKKDGGLLSVTLSLWLWTFIYMDPGPSTLKLTLQCRLLLCLKWSFGLKLANVKDFSLFIVNLNLRLNIQFKDLTSFDTNIHWG